MATDIPNMIQKLPLSVITRMQIERYYIKGAKNIKQFLHTDTQNESEFYPLVRNNRLYGDEALLRNYAGLKDDLYAIIEHGLYFGNNTTKVGLKHEWELGCVLTFGDYRLNLIKSHYQDYYCNTIGPLIHYATRDEDYYNYIRSRLDRREKTFLFFPVHGNELFSAEYDKEHTISEVLRLADERSCRNILICAFITDLEMLEALIHKMGLEHRVTVVSCGNRYSEKFLCKQRAIIESADYTASNDLGTHLGYCIYLGKPHYLLPEFFIYTGNEKAIQDDFGKKNRSQNYKDDFEKEKALFQKIFHSDTDIITSEMYSLCDYYWGFSKVKSASELINIYNTCNSYAKDFVRKNRFRR